MAWRSLESHRTPQIEPVRPPEDAVFGIRVLASGSGGNATLVYLPGESPSRPAWLGMIDAGISPGRVRKLLATDGLDILRLDDIIYTHLDRDHAQLNWSKLRACRATRRIHRRHVGRAQRDGHAFKKLEVFDKAFEPMRGVRVDCAISAHDQLGVAVFRLDLETEAGSASLGFATDVGIVEPTWVNLVSGVDVLAIESNYCPELQLASPRPESLKRRIMGGSGHLSNEEAAGAVGVACPRQHVVVLHPSAQCNTSERIHNAHARHGIPLSIATQSEPTPWIWAAPTSTHPQRTPETPPLRQRSLFDPSESNSTRNP